MEGWHNKLNENSKNIRNVHDLIMILRKDADLIPTLKKLLNEGQRIRETKINEKNISIHNAWYEYQQGNLNPKQLLNNLASF